MYKTWKKRSSWKNEEFFRQLWLDRRFQLQLMHIRYCRDILLQLIGNKSSFVYLYPLLENALYIIRAFDVYKYIICITSIYRLQTWIISIRREPCTQSCLPRDAYFRSLSIQHRSDDEKKQSYSVYVRVFPGKCVQEPVKSAAGNICETERKCVQGTGIPSCFHPLYSHT